MCSATLCPVHRVLLPIAAEKAMSLFGRQRSQSSPLRDRIRAELTVARGGSREISFDLAPQDWEKTLRGSEVGPFEVADLSLWVEGQCDSGETFFLHDGFTGGFSGGE